MDTHEGTTDLEPDIGTFKINLLAFSRRTLLFCGEPIRLGGRGGCLSSVAVPRIARPVGTKASGEGALENGLCHGVAYVV